MDDITDVRRSEVKHNHMNFPGIAFETADDVYEIGIQWTANPAVKRPNKYEDDWLDDVVELMSEQIEPVSFG